MFSASKHINNVILIQVPGKMDILHVLLNISLLKVKKITIAKQESLACTFNMHNTNLEIFFQIRTETFLLGYKNPYIFN